MRSGDHPCAGTQPRRANPRAVTTTPDFFALKEDHEADHAVERAARWILIAMLVAIGAVVVTSAFS